METPLFSDLECQFAAYYAGHRCWICANIRASRLDINRNGWDNSSRGMLDKQSNHPTVVWKTGKKNKSPSTLRRDKNRLLKWLELKKMNTDTDSISSYIPTYNADDVNITPRAQQNMNTTVSELTVFAEDNSGIPYNSSIIVSLPTVSSCFNETSISNNCNKPTTVNSYSSDRATRIQKGREILRRWQLLRRSYTHKGKPTSMILSPDY